MAGIDEEGKGCVYSFDPVGSYERETFRAGGSASSMLQVLLDNQVRCLLLRFRLWILADFGYAAFSGTQVFLPNFSNFLCPQVGFKNMQNVPKLPLSQEKAVNLVKDVFISASERDIYTGDEVELHVITKDGVKTERFPLRKD